MPETPDTNGAYPRLSQEQIRVLATQGERRAVHPGDVLFRDGDFVVLAGKVAVVEGYESADERLLVVHGPGRFLGELGLLTGQAASLAVGATAQPAEQLAYVRQDSCFSACARPHRIPITPRRTPRARSGAACDRRG